MAHDPDLYIVPSEVGTYTHTDKRSRFIGVAQHTRTPVDAEALLERLRREYHDATHHCFAWIINDHERFSDAGEPSGTAGRPVIDAIRSAGVTQAGVIVVRYFGGVKLGPGGLKRAYGEAARGALALAGARSCYRVRHITVTFDHADTSPVHHVAHQHGAKSMGSDYGNRVQLHYELRASRAEPFMADITEATGGRAELSECLVDIIK